MALATLFGLGLAFSTTPWGHVDEKAHTGYVLTLADWHLPDLDTRIPAVERAEGLEWAVGFSAPNAEGQDVRRRVWVANHPPGAYLPVAPVGWWALKSGHGDDVLRGQRIAHVIAGALMVGFTALLARELSGRPEVGMVAAGITALSPHFLGTVSTGITDGMATAALVATIWATARAVRMDLAGRSVMVVTAGAVACGLTRFSALAVAGVVVVVGLGVVTWRRRRPPWGAALQVGLAVALTSGWFYVLTTARYGDPAASDELLARFDRAPRGSWWEIATTRGVWEDALRTLTVTYRGGAKVPGFFRADHPHQMASTVILVIVALAIVVVAADLLRHGPPRGAPEPSGGGPNRLGWVLLVVALAVTFATTASHVSQGGYAHARYILLGIPAAACAVAHATGLISRGGGPRGLVSLLPAIGLVGLHALLLPDELDLYLRAHTLGSPVARWGALAGAGVAVLVYLGTAAQCLTARPEPGPGPTTATAGAGP